MSPLGFRSLNRSTACVLAISLLGGLACDENAPTESRAPATPKVVGADASEADLSASSVSALAITLPVNQSVSTVAPAPAFRVNQTGTGPDGNFQISNTSNTQIALQGLTNGKGRAGFFRIVNSGNSQAALWGQTNGSGVAVQGVTGGSGGAALFQNTNSGNASNALTASTVGRGAAASFVQTGSNFPSLAALEVSCSTTDCRGARLQNTGTGQAALIIVTNTNNTEPALWVRSDAAAAYGMQVDGSSHFFGDVQVGLSLSRPANSTFNGNVAINGTLTKSAGSFRIDHPLDPEHKYLSHSFVESPDMMNVYNGNAILDANGRATVELPEYFEVLNRDFRYQLTAIGAPGPNLYIAKGVQQNRFQIAGGRSYAHVSWQVTGVRKDAYAEEHRIKAEEDKPAAEPALITRR